MHRAVLIGLITAWMVGCGGGGAKDDAGTTVTVRFTGTAHALTEAGDVQSHQSFQVNDVQLAVLQSSGSYALHPGVVRSDKDVDFVSLPEGERTACWRRECVTTSETVIDWSLALAGRPDAGTITASTPFSLSVSGLAPWQPTDDLVIQCANLDMLNGGLTVASASNPVINSPDAGATAISDMGFDYSKLGQPSAVSAAAGDLCLLTHATQTPFGNDGGFVLQTVQSAALPAFTVTNGQPVSVSAALTDVPATQTLNVTWKRGDYTAALGAHRSGTYIWNERFAIRAYPFGPNGRHFSSILSVFLPQGAVGSDDLPLQLPWGNPYPAEYVPVCQQYVLYATPFPTSAGTTDFLAYSATTTPVANCTGDLGMQLGPALNPKINGKDAFSLSGPITATPTVSWDNPTRGTPTFAWVEAFQLSTTGGGLSTFFAGRVKTTGTSVRFPPGLLTPGNQYSFSIHLIANDAPAPLREIYTAGFTSDSQLLLGIFSP